MPWRLFLVWLVLLVIGGGSAMLFWSSFNRLVGGSGTGRDVVWLVLGIVGVLVSLVLARHRLRHLELEGDANDESSGAAVVKEGRVGHVRSGSE